ncbi:MAG: hypothetical protein GF401_16740 [Chitinivibrionales bacterium]|nr:hypothetical protein [Chitinivibrionales bacterium]
MIIRKCGCGRNIADGELIRTEKRQVFDIPPSKVEITEHQAETLRCECGEIHTAPFPQGVDAPVQYGPRLRAIIANGYRANPITEKKAPGKRGRQKQSPARNLLDRVDLLYITTEPGEQATIGHTNSLPYGRGTASSRFFFVGFSHDPIVYYITRAGQHGYSAP